HDIAALHRGDAQTDRDLAVVLEQTPRRILVAPGDRRDVFEEQQSARVAGSDRQIEHVARRAKLTCRIERDVFVSHAASAAFGREVSGLELVVDLFLADAEFGQPPARELEEDDFLLLTEQIDLLDAVYRQQLAAQELGIAPQFGLGEAFATD